MRKKLFYSKIYNIIFLSTHINLNIYLIINQGKQIKYTVPSFIK